MYLFFNHVEQLYLSNLLDMRTSELSLKNTLSSSVGISPPHSRNFKFISKLLFLIGTFNCSMVLQNKYFGANLLSLSQEILGYSCLVFLLVTLGFPFLRLALENTINHNVHPCPHPRHQPYTNNDANTLISPDRCLCFSCCVTCCNRQRCSCRSSYPIQLI